MSSTIDNEAELKKIMNMSEKEIDAELDRLKVDLPLKMKKYQFILGKGLIKINNLNNQER